MKKESQELKEALSDLLKVITVTSTFSAGANAYFKINFAPEIPDGYIALGVMEWIIGTVAALPSTVTMSYVEGRNVMNTTISNVSVTLKILCVKN